MKKFLVIPVIAAIFTIIPFSLQDAYADHTIRVPSDYSTIQGAIDAANSGDRIEIAHGTYVEQITLNKSLEIKGSENTIIETPSVLSADAFGAKNVIDVTNGATVKISHLTVSGPGPTGCGSITTGIFVSGDATLKIEKSVITDIRDNPASGCQNGIGILVGRNSYGTTGHAEIRDVKITNYQKGGIVIDNVGSTAKIEHNQLDWGLAPLNIASNGIQISRGATADVSDNTITGNVCSAPSCGTDLLNDYQSTGILLFQPGNKTVVKNNHLSNNDVGIIAYSIPSAVKIDDNKINQNDNVAGIVIQDGTNTISHNDIQGTESVGIGIIADSVDTLVTLEHDKIKGATTPIETLPIGSYTATFVEKK